MASLVTLGLALVELATEIVRRIPSRAGTPDPNRPRPPFRRGHAWGYGLSDPVRCGYCGDTLAADGSNRDAQCMGPKW